MIFNSKQYVPLIYRSSRDYEALLRLLDTILTTVKYEIDTLINLYVPSQCIEEFLPLLAEHIGYQYSYKDTVSENRIIIANFNKMIRNRGSVTGIKLASALSLNSIEDNIEQIDNLSELDVFFDYDTGRIIILYPNENTKVRNLIDWVRPVGMWCEEVPADSVDTTTELNINAYANVYVVPYSDLTFSGIGVSELYNGIITEVDSISGVHTWKDLNEYTWEEAGQFEWQDFLSNIDINNPIYVLFDSNGGTLNVSGTISTYSGLEITLLTESDVTFGLNKLTKWKNLSNSQEYNPGEKVVINSGSNVTMKAIWDIPQQHYVIIDQDLIKSVTQSALSSIKIHPLYINTPWKILIEYRENNQSSWTVDSIINADAAIDIYRYQLYAFINNTGQYRVSIGYYGDITLNTDKVNINAFADELYQYASIIDLSGLSDITYDLFNNTDFITNEIIYDNIFLTSFVFPPNITTLTIPYKFLSNCGNLTNIQFPTSNSCELLFNNINGTQYTTHFLENAGINSCPNTTFEIPATIKFIYKNYNNNFIQIFNNLGIAQNIDINCGIFLNSSSDTQIANVAFSFYNSITNCFINVTINSICDIYDIDSNDKIDTITLSKNSSINSYSNIHNLSTIGKDIIIETDTNGASTTINEGQFCNGNVVNVSLGDAINTIANNTFNNLPELLSVNIPLTCTEIHKTSFQQNNKLTNINFSANSNRIIQGFNNLAALTNIYIPNTANLNTCFYNCASLQSVTFSNILIIDYESIFVQCNNLTTLSVNSMNYSVTDNVLYTPNNTTLLWVPWGISDVTTTSNTEVIGVYSFSGCRAEKLSDYVIGETIESDIINYYDSVTLSESVQTINETAFDLTNISVFTVLNSNLDLSNIDITTTTIQKVRGHINSTAHIFAVTNNIQFESIDIIIDNINGTITDEVGTNIL